METDIESTESNQPPPRDTYFLVNMANYTIAVPVIETDPESGAVVLETEVFVQPGGRPKLGCNRRVAPNFSHPKIFARKIQTTEN